MINNNILLCNLDQELLKTKTYTGTRKMFSTFNDVFRSALEKNAPRKVN